MLTLTGKNNTARVMIDTLDPATHEQLQRMLDSEALAGSTIRIMADTHAGKGSVVGFTATLTDRVVPNVVGVDIGCGIEAYRLNEQAIDFPALDAYIRATIPYGFAVNRQLDEVRRDDEVALALAGSGCEAEPGATTHRFLEEVREVCGRIFGPDPERQQRALLSLGSLGGGNHFIEIDTDEAGVHWLLLHSGSRNFGLQVCNHHQERARALMRELGLQDAARDLEFLPRDQGGDQYLADMRVATRFALLNRHVMARRIVEGFFGLRLEAVEKIKTVHNTIDFRDDVIRKGAIAAHAGQRVLIPINMRDGVITGRGKGALDWNASAPHGAGRLMGRNEARRRLSVTEFEHAMQGVWSSCVGPATLDEAPLAYKPLELILGAIGETVEVEQVLRPAYNFKAA